MHASAYLPLLPPLLLVPVMGLLSLFPGKNAIGRELRRKGLHIAVGLAALSFPLLLTEAWMVAGGLLLALGWMTAVRHLPGLQRYFGSVLHDCGRHSMGEVYFALSIAGLILVTRQSPLLFAIPVLILSLADAAAAIAGRLIPSTALTGSLRGKTVAGCTAFFVVSAAICLAMLANFTNLPAWQVVVAALVVATATCTAEALARRGLDNLLVPVVAWTVLRALDLSAKPAIAIGFEIRNALRPITGGLM
jgi:phytol kinase